MSGTKSLGYQRVFVWHTRPFVWPIKLLQHVLHSRWKLFLVLRFFLLSTFFFLVFSSQFQDNAYLYSSHTTNFTQAQEHTLFFLSFRNTHLPFWNYIYTPKIFRQQYMLFFANFRLFGILFVRGSYDRGFQNNRRYLVTKQNPLTETFLCM